MSFHDDLWNPRYVDNAAVTGSTTLVGGTLVMCGSLGVSIQVLCSNGAAGTVYVDATNQDGVGTSFVTTTTQTVAANGSLYQTYSLTDQLTSFAQMRVRFAASASGNVTIATNFRRHNN